MRTHDGVGSTKTKDRTERYQQIVEHFEQVARANIGMLVHVEDLSRIAGINQRTLSRAFREVRGIGPHRFLQYLRLNEVKRVLSSEEGTITQAAMRFGFRELGKFGVLYRKAFGESPSETRRRMRSVNAALHHDPPHARPPGGKRRNFGTNDVREQ
jgi:transcriptional regulator GlxA family with amidase domain